MVLYATQFAKHFGRSPAEMGADEVRTFLLHLVTERKVGRGTVRIARAALKFLSVATQIDGRLATQVDGNRART